MEPIGQITSSVPGLMGANGPATPHGQGKALEDACNDFIGVLYSMVFSSMRGSGDDADEGAFFSGEHSQMLMGFLDQEVGRKMATSEGNSLAKQLFWQLSKAENPQIPQGKAP